ncbi:hypothetical protein ACIAM9_18870, partial [Acinetobacter baumannii]|uniref:hypothetical protein n=1 Tax=Acinetobacter baumannii TaxID=470 RepID=UPI00378E01A1
MRKILGAALVLASLALTGCGDTVQEGSVGIQRGTFSGKYENEVLPSGWYIRPFTEILVTDSRE